jgi:GNAT superfamily N-acetyltransferase
MVELVEILDPARKAEICESVLRALPDWFGIEESTLGYIEKSRSLVFFAAEDAGTPVGFAAVKVHTACAAELYVTGILEAYHRQGIGRQLVERCADRCRELGLRFLTVKTLDVSAESELYDRTRAFYLAQGFLPLEVFPALWDPGNPCLFLAKPL